MMRSVPRMITSYATCYCLAGIVLIGGLFPQGAASQSTEEDVIAVIDTFFEGMATQDTTKMWGVTDRGARLVITTFSKEGEPIARPISMDQFMGFVTASNEQRVVETYWNLDVRIHDNLATVWNDYNLWVGDQIDHCGKDAFQLAKTGSGWKIIAIADTQRRSGCEAHGDALETMLGNLSDDAQQDRSGLEGAPWNVTHIGYREMVDGAKPQLQFNGGKLTGNASCNTLSGSYALDNENLTLSKIATTRRACERSIMQQEAFFLRLLGVVLRHEIAEDGTLVIYTDYGDPIMARR